MQPLTCLHWGLFKTSIYSSLQNGRFFTGNSEGTAQGENDL